MWVRNISTVNASTKLNEIRIKIPVGIFVKSYKLTLKFIWKCRGPCVAKLILGEKRTNLENYKTWFLCYYRAIVINTVWCCLKSLVDHWNTLEDLEITPHLYGWLFFIQLCDDYIFKEWLSVVGDTNTPQRDRGRIYNCNFSKRSRKGRLGGYYQVLAGRNIQFFWKQWTISGRCFKRATSIILRMTTFCCLKPGWKLVIS